MHIYTLVGFRGQTWHPQQLSYSARKCKSLCPPPPPINSHKSVVHAVASPPKPVAVFRSYTRIHCDTGSRPLAQSIVLPNRALEFRRPGSVEGRRSVVAAALVLSSLAASHMHDRCVKCACSCSGGLNPKSYSAAGVGIWSNLRFASAYRYGQHTDECREHGWPEIGDLPLSSLALRRRSRSLHAPARLVELHAQSGHSCLASFVGDHPCCMTSTSRQRRDGSCMFRRAKWSAKALAFVNRALHFSTRLFRAFVLQLLLHSGSVPGLRKMRAERVESRLVVAHLGGCRQWRIASRYFVLGGSCGKATHV